MNNRSWSMVLYVMGVVVILVWLFDRELEWLIAGMILAILSKLYGRYADLKEDK